MKFNPIKVKYLEDEIITQNSLDLSSKISECKLTLYMLDKEPSVVVTIDKDAYKKLLIDYTMLYILENSSKGLTDTQLVYKKQFEEYLEQFNL